MFEFETSAGNKYAWDEDTGLFIPFSQTMKAVVNEILNHEFMIKEDIIERLKNDFSQDEVAFCYDWIKKWKKIRLSNAPRNPSLADIKTFLFKYGFNQLTLCVTEDCNFRCNYCIFSDNYEHTRSHSKKYMDFATAKKSIDYYFSLLIDNKKYNPLRKPNIAFYGGEPLLNFVLIKKCVGYVKKVYPDQDILFSITTNGSLLDKEKADWLMSQKFSISVSLDGPEEEHNRNRRYINKKGTFKDIVKNIGPIMDVKYKNIHSLPVFDWKSNLFNIANFFDRENIPLPSSVSQVASKGKYYSQFREEDRCAFLEQIEEIEKYYLNEFENNNSNKMIYFSKLIGNDLVETLLGSNPTYSLHPIISFSGACVPGYKIFVDVNGFFHICERVSSLFPIGDVNEGLNFEKISQIVHAYLKSMDKCSDCKNMLRCTFCYTEFMTETGFAFTSKVCQKIENNMKESFIEAFDIAEKNSRVIDVKFKYKNIWKYYGD